MAEWDEAQVIERIRVRFDSGVAPGALAFTSDVAILPEARGQRVITTDVVVEGVDFAKGLGPPESAGFRAVVQNLSDLAAAGAKPVGFVWSMAVPSSWWQERLWAFVEGAARAATTYGCPLLGGDLSRTRGPFVCSITALGDVDGMPLTRTGAAPGDGVFCTARFGASAAGLAALKRGEPGHAAVDAHLWPTPALAAGQALVGHASAALDVTDGLARDAHRLARASRVQLVLDVTLAIDARAGRPAEARRRALFGGEDYALLFTVPPARIESTVGIRIGTVRAGAGVIDEQGRAVPDRGYDHVRVSPTASR